MTRHVERIDPDAYTATEFEAVTSLHIFESLVHKTQNPRTGIDNVHIIRVAADLVARRRLTFEQVRKFIIAIMHFVCSIAPRISRRFTMPECRLISTTRI